MRTHGLRIVLGIALLCGLLGVIATAGAAPARDGQTFLVTVTGDNLQNPPAGSLRKAIGDANASAGLDTIHFNIGSGGPAQLVLLNQLPDITSPVVIDGLSQPGSNGAPVVVLPGAGPNANGLVIRSGGSGSTIRGLVLNQFQVDAIKILDSSDNVVENNFIGTDVTGTLAEGNLFEGILIASESAAVTNNTIRNNLISANGGNGIHMTGEQNSGNRVFGNRIGVDINGNALGNDAAGVSLDNVAGQQVGGSGSGESNIIAYNGTNGIRVDGGSGNVFERNSIYGNGARGIRVIGLNPAGPTLNPNGPPPANSTVVTYAGEPATVYTIDFYENLACDPSGFGEGETWLTSAELTTDGNGSGQVILNLSGSFITATATGFETSEFSACYTGTPFASRTPTDTRTPTSTATKTDTPTMTTTPPSPTPTDTPTDTPTNTRRPTRTDTPTNTRRPTRTDTPTDTPTNTRRPTKTPTEEPTAKPTKTPTDGPTARPTKTPTEVPTPGPSPTVCAGKPGVPDPVSPTGGSTVFKRRVTLAWNGPSCATRYVVVVKEGSKTGPRVQKKAKLTEPQFATKELKKGQVYVWHVRACAPGKAMCSKFSPWLKFKVSKNAAFEYDWNDLLVRLTARTGLLMNVEDARPDTD